MNVQLAKDNLSLHVGFEEIAAQADDMKREHEELRDIEERDQRRIAENASEDQRRMTEKAIEDYKNIAEGYQRDIEAWKSKHKGLKKEVAKLR